MLLFKNKSEMLENVEDEDNTDNNINAKWESIKTIIKEPKQQLTEKDKHREKLKNIWYEEECKIAVEETKTARENWLIKERRENEKQKYHHKRKEVHKIIMNKKKLCIKNFIDSIDQKYNNTRKMYQTRNQFKKEYQQI